MKMFFKDQFLSQIPQEEEKIPQNKPISEKNYLNKKKEERELIYKYQSIDIGLCGLAHSRQLRYFF